MVIGDKIIFQFPHSMGGEYKAFPVERITATGRIICGPFTLNPDLTVRGGDRFGPARGMPATDELLEMVYKDRTVRRFKNVTWSDLPVEALREIDTVLKKYKKR